MQDRKLGLGVAGCGNISSIYFQNAPLFKGIELRACTDLNFAAAQQRGQQYGVRATSIDAFWALQDIDIVINLTVPQAHHEVTLRALQTGWHAYSEKPLATNHAQGSELYQLACARDLRLGVAPDTFSGPGATQARLWLDHGVVGRIVTGTACMMTQGIEHWHPDPRSFYRSGGGPLMDMGPYYISTLVFMLGPVAQVVAMGARGQAQRRVSAQGPLTGQDVPVEVDTTTLALLSFASGAIISLAVSWDVHAHGCRPIELHGTLGSLRVPDPNTFGGVAEYWLGQGAGRGQWHSVDTQTRSCGKPNRPEPPPYRNANYRMLGVAEMADAMAQGRAHRASGELGLHVLEVLEAVQCSAEQGRVLSVAPCAQPAPLSDVEREALLCGHH